MGALDMLMNDGSTTMVGVLVFLAAATLAFSIMVAMRVQGSVKRRAAKVAPTIPADIVEFYVRCHARAERSTSSDCASGISNKHNPYGRLEGLGVVASLAVSAAGANAQSDIPPKLEGQKAIQAITGSTIVGYGRYGRFVMFIAADHTLDFLQKGKRQLLLPGRARH